MKKWLLFFVFLSGAAYSGESDQQFLVRVGPNVFSVNGLTTKNTVGDLKEKIYEKTKVAPKDQRIFFTSERQMKDDASLEDAEKHSFIRMMEVRK